MEKVGKFLETFRRDGNVFNAEDELYLALLPVALFMLMFMLMIV